MPLEIGYMSCTRKKLRFSCQLLLWFTIPYVCAGCARVQAAHLDQLIIGDVMQKSELTQNLRALCVSGGRLSGSENAFAAERFVVDKARQYGLRNVHLEPFPMACWRGVETRVARVTSDESVCHGALALCNTMSTPPGGVTAEVIDASEGKQDDFERLGDKLRDRFALVRDGGDRRSVKMARALDFGAAGLVVVSPANHLPVIGTGCHAPSSKPAIIIGHDDGQAIAQLLGAGQAVKLNVQVRSEFWDAKPDNVVAEIRGHGPHAAEIVLLGAHLDSWDLAEGAIDNGNGSAVVLECARALRDVGWRPSRTVRFVWFMGEEQGLHGSHAYVAAHHDELNNMVAMINVDMPGSPRALYASGSPEFIDRVEEYRRSMVGYGLDEEVHKLSGGWSDHAPFVAAGVCSAALGGDLGPGVQNYHTVGDKFECVDQRATVQSAAALAVLVQQLADDASLKPGICPPDGPPASAPVRSSQVQSTRPAGRH